MRTLDELIAELKLEYKWAGPVEVNVYSDTEYYETEGLNMGIAVTVPNCRGGRDTLKFLYAAIGSDGTVSITVDPGY